MCGIAGIFGINGLPARQHELELMCNAMIARGPDDAGYFVDGSVGLGMRRLSIIDLAGGHQPVANEDGTIQVVLNGEIYNFRELRSRLEARGHVFKTTSDTEVIVHAYEEYGTACVEHLRGMFGFALWDSVKRQLLVARDRAGIKPLYYGEFGGRLLFASELKSILALGQVDRELNWGSVSHLFAFLTTPRDESIVKGVHKLEPGHLLIARPGHAPVVQRYWDLEFQPDYHTSEAQFVDQLRGLLEESVKLCMISDVPLGAFLSGGIDSSSVVATMSRLSDRPVKTFSIGFREQAYDESVHARQVAQAFGTEHHELILDPDISGFLEDMAWHLDEPLGDSSAIPTYMVSKLASQHVKVVLSGDGGDELFAGYERYVVERDQRARRVPGFVRNLGGFIGSLMPDGMKGRRFLRHLALTGNDRYVNSLTMFARDDQRFLFCEGIASHMLKQDHWQDLAQYMSKEDHWLSRMQYLDFKHYLPLDILTKVDRMSMAHSIEARVPLLDHKLTEFAATIPPEMKLQGNSTKHIFKKALRGILPDTVLDRRKQGFAVPLGQWFRNEPPGFLHDLLLSDRSRARGIFNSDYVERMLALHQRGRAMDLQLWTLISFELWCRRFLDSPVTFAARRPARAHEAGFSEVPATQYS